MSLIGIMPTHLSSPRSLACSLHHENCPLAVIEAQAARTPIIATDVGGHRELIRDGVDGLLVPREDFGALVASMRTCVEDRDLVARLSAAAPPRPSLEEWAADHLTLFEGLVRGRAA